jgi:hypothetical protein
METLIKQELHQLIKDCTDESVLEEAKILLQDDMKVDWWDDLTEEDQNRVMESEAQYERGEFISHEELMKHTKQN